MPERKLLERTLGRDNSSINPPATVLLGAFAQYGGCPHALVSLCADSTAWCAAECGGVPYVERGDFWLAAGDPIAPIGTRVRMAKDFAAAAKARGYLPIFLPTTEEFAQSMLAERWTCLKLGSSPYFDLERWNPQGNIARHLRWSVNRAIKAGVTVEEVSDVYVLRETLDRLCADWLKTRLAGTSFGWLFALNPLHNASYKRFFVARDRRGAVVGLLATSPMPIRSGWYLEDVVRAPGSLQGVCDVLVYRTLRTLQAEAFKTATLGTVLFADDGVDLTPIDEWPGTRKNLKIAKRVLAGFYNFNGLHSFKSKFVPTRWESEYVVMPEAGNALRPWRIALAALRAILPGGVWPMVRYLVGQKLQRCAPLE